MPWDFLARLCARKDLRRARDCHKPRFVRPRLEPLEDRVVPSGNGILAYTVPTAGSEPWGITTGPDNNLWIAEHSGDKVAKLTTSGVFTEYGVSGSPQFLTANDANVWVTGTTTPTVYKVSQSGSVTAYDISPGNFSYGVGGITVGQDGNLWETYVLTTAASKIGMLTPSGSATEHSVTAGFDGTDGIVTGPDGNLWFTDSGNSRIGVYSPVGGGATYYSTPTANGGPEWIATGPDGNLWFTEESGNKIGRITTSGVVTEFNIPTANSQPRGITAGPDGALWFTEYGGNQIGRITTAGVVTEYGGLSAGADPESITVGPNGGIWFTEPGANKIGTFDWPLGGGAVTLDPAQGLWERVPDQPGSKYAPATGTLHAEIPLDFMQSGTSCDCGASALVYNSDSVDVRPVINVAFGGNAGDPVPTRLQARLVWNGGTPGAWTTISTAGRQPGDTYSFSLEETTPVTATGVYGWEVDVQATLPDGTVIDRDVEGYTPVVVNDNSPIGAGWSVGKIDSLVPVAAGGVVPAGVLYVYGYGQSRFFKASGSGYASPANDFGTLTQSGGGWVYTDTHQLKHTFNAAGQLVGLSDPHGLSNTYANGLLTGITMYDGGQTAFLYWSNGLLTEVDEPGGRRVLVAHTGADLTGVTNADNSARAFGYDGTHHLTNDQRSPLSATYGYDAATGALTSITLGDGRSWAVSPAWLRELQTGSALGAAAPDTVTDGLNRVTSLVLDGLGRLLSEAAPDGSTVSRTLDIAGDPTAVTDGDGHTTQYVYAYGPAGRGDLTQITNPDGTTEQFQYDPTFDLPTLEVDAGGQRTAMAYDPTTGDLLTETDALGRTTSYAYVQAGGHSNGEVQSVTDPAGVVTQYAYDGARRVTQEIDAYGTAVAVTTTMAYDGAGNLVSETTGQSPNNSYAHPTTTTYTYDGLRRVLTETDAYGTPQQRTTTYVYDAAGNLTSVTDPDGNVTQYAYGPGGERTQEIDAYGTAVAVTTTMGYDAAGQLTSETTGQSSNQSYARPSTTTFGYDGLGRVTSRTDASGTPQARTVTTTYDLAGNVLTVTDGAGNVTQYGYDAMNRMVTETDGYGTAAASTTTRTYDYRGNVLFVTTGQSSDPSYAHPETTQYGYDALGRLISEVDGFGTASATETGYVYDAAGNLWQVDAGASPLPSYARPSLTVYGYDALGRRTSEADAYSTGQVRTVLTAYDAAGDVVSTTDGLGNVTAYGYDALDRQVSVTDPLGHTSTTTYDADDNVLTTTDANNDATQYAYDALNRQVQTTDAAGGVTRDVFDAAGDRISLTDPDGNITTMLYDALGRMTSQTDALSHTTSWAYDGADRLTSTTDALGEVRNMAYDALNRETGETWVVSGVTTDTQAFTYDAANDQLTAGDDSGSYTMAYDVLGRMTSEAEPFGLSLAFGYDAGSARVSTTDSLGGVTTSAYDALDRLTQRSFGGTGQTAHHATLTWTADDQLSALSRYDDVNGTALAGTSAYVYDNAQRLMSLQQTYANGGTLASYAYAYDAGDRLTSQTINGVATTYGYDKTDQLTQDGATAHGYDAAGNRDTAGYQVGAANQITTDGTWAYTYDADGRLVKKSKGTNAETWTYGYDAKGRMTSAQDRATDGGTLITSITYVYDVFDRLIEEDVTPAGGATAVTRWGYDGNNAWAELNGSNQLTMRRLYLDGADQPLARIDGSGNAAWYLADKDGSIRDVVSLAGATVLDQRTYDAFGNVTAETTPANGDWLGFDGGHMDVASGFTQFGARWYNPSTGAWDERDPIGLAAGDYNTTRFVHNGPTDATDPSGLVARPTLRLFGTSAPPAGTSFGGEIWNGLLEGNLPWSFTPPAPGTWGWDGRQLGHDLALGQGLLEIYAGGGTSAGAGGSIILTGGTDAEVAAPVALGGLVVAAHGGLVVVRSGYLIFVDAVTATTPILLSGTAMCMSAIKGGGGGGGVGPTSGGGNTSGTPAQNIADHLIRDHPERFGRDRPRLVREVQNVIDNATQQHTVQHGSQAGSQFYYRNGRSVMVRPNGQGTMVLDPNGNSYRNWVNLEP